MGKPWTRDEDQVLLDGAGVFAVAWFERKLGRSRAAIYARSRRLGKAGLSRGTQSLEQLVRDTGYGRKHLVRARVALDQKWKRLSAGGRFLITFEQANEIINWLRHDYWCLKLRLYGCVNCGASSRPPGGLGQCPKCYWKMRRSLIRIGLPSGLHGLRAVVEDMEADTLTLRRLSDQLVRGQGPTEDQVKALATALRCS